MIKIKSATQIEQMKKAGALSKMALRHVGAMVRPGVSTFELDQLAEQIIRMHGGTPAFKGYGGFPGTICASINDAVVHGIPNPDMILRDADPIQLIEAVEEQLRIARESGVRTHIAQLKAYLKPNWPKWQCLKPICPNK